MDPVVANANAPQTFTNVYVAPKTPFLALFFALCLIMGSAFFYQEWQKENMADASQGWSTTQGKILSSNVASVKSGKGGATYALRVEYNYTVDGKNYTSDRVSFGEVSLGDRGAVAQRAAKYPLGGTTTVYYDTNNPYQAVLEPGASGGNFLGLAIGALFALVGFAGLVWYLRK